MKKEISERRTEKGKKPKRRKETGEENRRRNRPRKRRKCIGWNPDQVEDAKERQCTIGNGKKRRKLWRERETHCEIRRNKVQGNSRESVSWSAVPDAPSPRLV